MTLNTTVTETGAAGYLTVHPHGAARPLASNLNWTAGQTVPNQMVVQVLDGKLSFYNGSAQSTQLIVDLVGYHSF
ncbi:N-acetylmuramoyl-L-alanine amidase [Kitasatospora gansuensis]